MFAYCENGVVNYSDCSGHSIIPSTYISGDITSKNIPDPPDSPTMNSRSLKRKALQMKSALCTEDSWKTYSNTTRNLMVKIYYKGLSVLLDIQNYQLILYYNGSDEAGYGHTENGTKKIYLNTKYIYDYGILGTLAHECYHAYQFNCIEFHRVDLEPECVLRAWQESFDDYNNYDYLRYTEISAYWFEDDLLDLDRGANIGRGYYR